MNYAGRRISQARFEFAAESVDFLNGFPGDGLVTRPGGEPGAVGGEGDRVDRVPVPLLPGATSQLIPANHHLPLIAMHRLYH